MRMLGLTDKDETALAQFMASAEHEEQITLSQVIACIVLQNVWRKFSTYHTLDHPARFNSARDLYTV
eukprot:NODE_4349_length_322_cov_28.183150_g4267_i0.p1 GENE.NODE_4349_length_322_cov_28.183150_g4267_i0~~NODE_4349_length_322_cov_28.183150_g4267_i0.p1  ORF type:complete len:67 (-),score=4.15 NODE_4349_length_322_cov_28.183150_g4267_i0:79-279(-)